MSADPPINVLVSSNDQRYQIHEQAVQDIATEILRKLNVHSCVIDISFITQETMLDLCKRFVQKDYATDVLSFGQVEWKPEDIRQLKPLLLNDQTIGDVVICLDVAKKNSQNIGQSLEREVAFLILHGILHLMGFDHIIEDDRTQMRAQEERVMNTLNQNSPWVGMVTEGVAHATPS